VPMADLQLFNSYKDRLGNPHVDEKLRRPNWKQESDIVRAGSLPRWLRSMAVIALVVAALALVVISLTFLQQVSLMMVPSTPPSWPVWAKVWIGFWLGMALLCAVLAWQQWWAKGKR
ncbi:MAG: hypothetical protein J2P56_10575, partial [Verrucomicrobia bacterium]|nr:hypothetical protein [Verrucomicrobiota bacterium]